MAVAKNKSGSSRKLGSKKGPSLAIGPAATGPAQGVRPPQGKISLASKALKGVVARKAAAKGVLSGFGRAVLRAGPVGILHLIANLRNRAWVSKFHQYGTLSPFPDVWQGEN